MRRSTKLVSVSAAVAAFALTVPHVAHANLVFDSSIHVTAQGFGNVPRDLTIQQTGNSPNPPGTESGCISVSGGALAGGPGSCISDSSVYLGNGVTNVGGDEVSPLSDNQKFGIPTIGSLGITDASQIQILFNPDEGQSAADQSINVADLTLKIYNGDTLVAAIDGQQNFPTSDPGVGIAGFVFVVDATEQTFLNNNVFNQPGYSNFRLALESTLTDAQGGPDSYVILEGNGALPPPVPEPLSLSLLATGLLGMGLTRRRKTA